MYLGIGGREEQEVQMGRNIQLDPRGTKEITLTPFKSKGTKRNFPKVLSNNISLACWFRSLEGLEDQPGQ